MSETGNSQEAMSHAALWLIGPDMPGLLNLGSKFVTDRGGNIDKDIADRFGEKAVVFISLTAEPSDIQRMQKEAPQLKKATNCGVVFQPMHNAQIPEACLPDLYGFDIITDDAPGLLAKVTDLVSSYGILIVGHTGERRAVPGPRQRVEFGQKFVVMVPHRFDHHEFANDISKLVKSYNGSMVTPLRTVPGLLWWW